MRLAAVVTPIALAFIVSFILTRRLSNPGSMIYMLDQPNERSLHSIPVPRTGGIAILISIYSCGLVGLFFLEANVSMFWFAAAGLLVATVSFIDDWIGLTPAGRIAAHLTASLLLLFGGFGRDILEMPGVIWAVPQVLGAFISVLFIVWMVNLYNFMDGIDGFAAGMAVIGFGCFAVFGWLAGNALFFNLSLIIMAATAGFLIFNFPPARIFMGDVGSSLLGLLAAALSLWGAREGIFPFWAAILVFSPFIVDATATLIRRLFRGEKIWQAHKTHYYQRLVQLGWGHRKTVLWEYGLMVACAISALWAVRQTIIIQWLILSIWVVLYSLLMLWIPRLEERNRK